MADQRTELRDELTVLIAAGRELTPDHDQALAEVFVDHVAKSMPAWPPARQGPTIWDKPGRLLAAAFLGLAGLGAASVLGAASMLSVQHTEHAQYVSPVSRVIPIPLAPAEPPAPNTGR